MASVLYFSRADENFVAGSYQHLLVGNTEIVSKKIARKLGVEAYAIRPVKAYPFNYTETVKLAESEKQQQARPAIEPVEVDVDIEQILFLGYPNWWGTYPMAMASFLDGFSSAGKIIFPFCTHEGSGLGSSIIDLQAACPQAEIKPGLAIRGSKVAKADEAIKNWLSQYYCNQTRCHKSV